MKELIMIQSELKAPKTQVKRLDGDKYRKAKKGECETTTGLAREEETKKGMEGSQITGASSSYARKNALNGLFAIDDNADSDTTNTGQQDNTHHLAAQQTAQTQQQSQATAQSAQPLYHPYNLVEALEMVKRCVNRYNIIWVMCAYKPFKRNPQFIQALSAKRKELGL